MNRIKILLTVQNKRSKELACYLGCTTATVSRWCKNKSQPDVKTLYEIAQFLNIDVRELLQPSKK